MSVAKEERWMVGAAASGAAILHVALLLVVAWQISRTAALKIAAEPEEEEQFVLISADLLQPRYVRTSVEQESEAEPEQQPFFSDRNTLAAAELAPPPEPEEQRPSQDGEKLPFTEMANRELNEGEVPADQPAGAQPSPPTPSLPPTPPTPPVSQSTPPPGEETPEDRQREDLPPEEDLLAKVKGMEAVPILPPVEDRPPQPEQNPATPTPPPATPGADVFTPQTRKNVVHGTLSNRGPSAVNAVRTARGEYTKAANTAIEKRWHLYRRQHLDFATFGNLRLKFMLVPEGGVRDLSIISQDANAVMADFTLRAIRDAKIPPMPADLRADLAGEPLEFVYDVLIY